MRIGAWPELCSAPSELDRAESVTAASAVRARLPEEAFVAAALLDDIAAGVAVGPARCPVAEQEVVTPAYVRRVSAVSAASTPVRLGLPRDPREAFLALSAIVLVRSKLSRFGLGAHREHPLDGVRIDES